MPTEFRFDDLDLREDPASRARSESDYPTWNCTYLSQQCGATARCTVACCTDTCSDAC